ncbi:hypothetical protein [Dactylosporangium sp. CA-092794]|uniref:hypothetical protein n=1 Tax=Dactylosporangium sp. CA-092794 TaxID=3239929 RepID=UPI003D8FEAEA
MLAVLVAGGCGGGGERGGATSAAASPEGRGRQVLVAAVKGLEEGGYSYTMTIDQGTVTGAVDPSGKRRARLESVASGVRFSLEGIVLGGGERYFRTSIPAKGVSSAKWYRFDRTKVAKLGIIGLFETDDPTSSQQLADRVSGARVDGQGRIVGEYDLTRGGDLGVADGEGLAVLGERAKGVPFVATVDGQGRLGSVRITVPAYGRHAARTIAVDYRDQGRPVAIVAPKAGEVLPATAAVYSLLNN